MTEAEIAGYMGWRGPGAYTQHQMRKIKEIVEEVQRREREACAKVCEQYADTNTWDGGVTQDFHAKMIRARGQA